MLAPQFERIRRLEPVARGVRGLLAAFIAMLFVVFWQVGKASLTDLPTLLTAAAAFLLIRRKVNPIWPILAASALWAVMGR